ncbi:MAG: MBL fold metallo-hydrolase [Fidelibacterota bacterium]|nr:MAG: MBL fold metallo-hydrolase [Candidatus Neomarinimicrobiota bacterium]
MHSSIRTFLLLPLLACTAPTEESETPLEPCTGDTHVWYLGANGYAVSINNKLLIFDYQEGTDPDPPAAGKRRNLQRGYIDPDELQSCQVYVFVTHSHFDHYDPVIYQWESRIDSITYFFGWEAGDDPEHHYLSDYRAQTQVGDMEVYTIYSHHAGVPEVAYLVKVDGATIYHNGDYKAEYVADYTYLGTLADSIDMAFVIGVPDVNHQYFLQAVLLVELFSPTYIFPMNREDDPSRIRQFRNLFQELQPDVQVLCPEERGDSFACPLPGEEGT